MQASDRARQVTAAGFQGWELRCTSEMEVSAATSVACKRAESPSTLSSLHGQSEPGNGL